jgi:uncharacterized protein (UPF0332 family)
VDPKEFLSLAEILKQTKKEAHLRTAISRSYYALFNLLRDFLCENGIPFSRKVDDHKKVYFYFHNSKIEEFIQIGKDLDDLREERNDADYEMSATTDDNNVQLLFAKARCAYNSFNKLIISKKQKDALIQNILAYIKINPS